MSNPQQVIEELKRPSTIGVPMKISDLKDEISYSKEEIKELKDEKKSLLQEIKDCDKDIAKAEARLQRLLEQLAKKKK